MACCDRQARSGADWMIAACRKLEIMISPALTVLTILFGFLLAGCQTTEERLAAAAADDAQCKSYGIEPSDPAYVECRTNLANNRAGER
jgi:hypothetical protein